MQLTPGERNMIVTALTVMAEQYRREASGRRWYGPQFRRVRAEARAQADAYQTLAKQVKSS